MGLGWDPQIPVLTSSEYGIDESFPSVYYAELTVDASVVRSGRNVTVIAVEFKMRETSQLVYTARATFYNMPMAKL
ncbi:hypothetical protein CK203_032884 [Vitis vinifera]|uniref:Uncharacterized protein n=1 Tax=Vitis vinifera TaxID=29760 RepID=A0A438HL04_VITVI|nr:hypothetical protein CK203_032884 [Vitis vinifera]